MKNSFTQSLVVRENLTAEVLGSGSLPVYATPAVVALMENTACRCLDELPADQTTVGVHMDVRHTKASKVGECITCTATLTGIEGRTYAFSIVAVNAANEVIATATHERVQVTAARFMSKLNDKL